MSTIGESLLMMRRPMIDLVVNATISKRSSGVAGSRTSRSSLTALKLFSLPMAQNLSLTPRFSGVFVTMRNEKTVSTVFVSPGETVKTVSLPRISTHLTKVRC